MNYLHNIVTQWVNNEKVLALPAITTPEKTYTYNDLLRSAAQAVHSLIAKKLPIHAHVGIMFGNKYETVVYMLACSLLKHPFVLINPNTKPAKLKQIVSDSPVCLVLSDNEHTSDLEEVLEQNRQLSPHPDSTNLAALLYTSGSTGKPKGVMCPHSAMLAAINSINSYLNHSPKDTILTTLPLSHGYGLYQVLTGLAAGAHVVLEPGFLFIQNVLNRIEEVQATGFAVVPTMLTMIFKIPDWARKLDSLRYITNAGAGLPPSYNLKLRQNLRSSTHIIPMHGLTECVRTLYMPYEYGDLPPDAIGRPIPGVDAYIVDNNMVSVLRGEVGELIISGSNVMAGYWGRPEETKQVFIQSSIERVFLDNTVQNKIYLKTGDLFRQDERGYYYFVGRIDDVVKVRGERTSPKEIEDVIYEIDGVDQVAVIPIYDGVDNKLVAHVSTKVALTKGTILKWCKEHLESYMVPSDVHIWDELPKNDNGKIDRKALKAVSEV